MKNSHFDRSFLENQELEYIWTSLPALLLIILAIPSLKILYITEESDNPAITVNVTAEQWLWSYGYTDFSERWFDSFLLNTCLNRLLVCSNYLFIPYNTAIRLVVTSEDVIHSWSAPSLGVKVDAVPGRVNQLIIQVNRRGIFTGQCREICGAHHSFIPICISVAKPINFLKNISWYKIEHQVAKFSLNGRD